MTAQLPFGYKLKKFFFRNFALPRIKQVYALENSINDLENALKYSEDSAERFDIPMEFGRREGIDVPIYSQTVKHILSCIKNMKLAVYDLEKNPKNPKKKISESDLAELREFAKSVKVSGIGFTVVPQNLIFKHKAIAFENAIVLSMNMDNEAISTSPSKKSLKTIWYTYDKLSVASVKVARFLRKKGYATHASPPLGGIALYPKIAQEAGLGEFGYSGVLITPINGSTLRLAAVYTNIENLPMKKTNEHDWVRDFCEQCRRCIKECPPGAIYDTPIVHETGRVTHIDNEKCFPYFANNYGCTVCIKVCPFNNTDYYTIKNKFEKTLK